MVISDKLIERYRVLKAQAPGCLLLMQVGAFMQAMNEDARSVAAVTGFKLQVGGNVDAPTVLGGFPKSGLKQSIASLARFRFTGMTLTTHNYHESRSIVP